MDKKELEISVPKTEPLTPPVHSLPFKSPSNIQEALKLKDMKEKWVEKPTPSSHKSVKNDIGYNSTPPEPEKPKRYPNDKTYKYCVFPGNYPATLRKVMESRQNWAEVG